MGWALEMDYGADVITDGDRERVRQVVWRELDGLEGVEVSPAPPEPGKLGPLTDALLLAVASAAVQQMVETLIGHVKGRLLRAAKLRKRSGVVIEIDIETARDLDKLVERLLDDD